MLDFSPFVFLIYNFADSYTIAIILIVGLLYLIRLLIFLNIYTEHFLFLRRNYSPVLYTNCITEKIEAEEPYREKCTYVLLEGW